MHVRRLALLLFVLCLSPARYTASAQINIKGMMDIARNSLYYEDYVLSIQYFNMIINARPNLYEPWFYRGLAKFYLEDYTGSERDCTEAIRRNPYAPNPYELRGLVRISQKKYLEAADDYAKAYGIEGQNRSMLHNYILCELELDSLDKADSLCDIAIKKWGKYADGYCLKANVWMQKGDTLKAETFIDKALLVDKFNVNVLSVKGSILMQKQMYDEAEKMYDEAIRLQQKNAGLLVNRALCRYHQNNYRGAMKDYDLALEIDPTNFIGHYNRGLMRANVGDNNRAIEDFNFIISVDPDDMMAIFNRGELYMQTGEYKKAINDYTTVINEYPKFLHGYQRRAEAKRMIGDKRGADKDEEHVLIETMAHRYGYSTPTSRMKNKTRKKSERQIDDYDKPIEDNEKEDKYESQYRGKVQNRNTEATLIQELPAQVKSYNDLISPDLNKLFATACKKAQTGDVAGAIEDFSKALDTNQSFAEAYFNRGILRLLTDDVQPAIFDLSKAGELGIFKAYNIIKKNQNRKK